MEFLNSTVEELNVDMKTVLGFIRNEIYESMMTAGRNYYTTTYEDPMDELSNRMKMECLQNLYWRKFDDACDIESSSIPDMIEKLGLTMEDMHVMVDCLLNRKSEASLENKRLIDHCIYNLDLQSVKSVEDISDEDV